MQKDNIKKYYKNNQIRKDLDYNILFFFNITKADYLYALSYDYISLV